MRYLLMLCSVLFSCPVWSDTESSFSWKGTVPNISAQINIPISLGVDDIDSELRKKPWLKENKALSIKYSNNFGQVKIVEINNI
ncbi:hypothetical protein [Photobacterium angustum]|uniref:Uncharacterized protein n=1 Tax=Photobacterium angustum TaxID=661 RepID=A0A855S8Y2_PHOAN|nr:hypothetical protein [Photobacterium angustum]KJF81557.1 hypothetical protein UB36_10940 [Photobacterium damselae subsp. damselae]KJG35375.1 hypothetical protein UA35_21220 [Photobacterium angustum]KJG45203.1 hypothetical protein UA31_10945 [Photobacterium angustum]KJG48714.1 hypothetical protein UA30_11360 [Photobacterium angustum]KJG50272.1 hypothetical protein UA34_21320 [Photobacterium angustum]